VLRVSDTFTTRGQPVRTSRTQGFKLNDELKGTVVLNAEL
jgi:hypothetical protein